MRDTKAILEELIRKEIVKGIEESDIRKALERVIEKKNPENIVKDFFGKKSCNHPLVGKVINWGSFFDKRIKKSEPYVELNKKLTEIVERGLEVEYIIRVKDLLENLRNLLIDYIITEEIYSAEKGLRHIHTPGSVAKSEGRNFYFPGEEYTEDTLYWLAFRLCSSIALGDSFGIYSENENLMLKLKQLAAQKFGSKFRIMPGDLGIDKREAAHPYVALLGLTLWLMEQSITEEKSELKTLIRSILDELRTSPICVFFMPTGKKERWATIHLPRLDIFIDRWILYEKARKKLEDLRNELKRFIAAAYSAVKSAAKKERRVREIENTIDLLMDNYDTFCQRLMEYGSLDLYASRRMMDIILDLATRYGLSIYLHPLGSILSHGHPT